MEHFIVFALLIILLCGFWTAFVARRQYKASGVEPLKSLFRFIVSFNLLVFGAFVARYAHTNLIGDDPLQHDPAIWVITAVGVYILETGVTWTILRLAWDLGQKRFPRALTLTYLAAITLIGISYVIGATLVLREGSLRWIVSTHQAMGLFMTLGFCYALLVLIAGRHTNLNVQQRRSARYFGWFLIGGVLILPASLALPSPTYLFGFAAGMLWISCAPLLWLRRYAGPYQQTVTPEAASSAVAVLARRYGITRREREVMALLVEGKSNKEIEDVLCISFSTVKNHVYNLYRKLEVNSRAQLMHLVIVESARQEPRDTPVPS